MYKGKDKFNWKPGDIQINLSQCAYCQNNEGPEDCKVFGIKPEAYSLNREDCPSKIPE